MSSAATDPLALGSNFDLSQLPGVIGLPSWMTINPKEQRNVLSCAFSRMQGWPIASLGSSSWNR